MTIDTLKAHGLMLANRSLTLLKQQQSLVEKLKAEQDEEQRFEIQSRLNNVINEAGQVHSAEVCNDRQIADLERNQINAAFDAAALDGQPEPISERIFEQPDISPLTPADFKPLLEAGVAAERKLIKKKQLKKAAVVTGAVVGTAAVAVAVGHVAVIGAFLLTKRGIAAHFTGLAVASITGAVLGHQVLKHVNNTGINPE